ncbi:MAG: hypothetical protein Ta2D_01560 [Rickettsiales bacterium]|nr:MAG: hypothetical protein Ta2D_01560 [Rickettsiales bacterium]
MFKRFLAGFISIIPFVYLWDENIKNFPKDAFCNDWRVVGGLLKKCLKKGEK